MQQKVNYIIHLNKAFQLLNADRRLSPFHISLYYSLFQYWNISKFRNPISISRDDQMQASKIGSVNTYLKCLKELDSWGYIKYEPSHNPMKGSIVYLFTFDTTNTTTNNITSNTTTDNGNNNTPSKTTKTTLKKVVRPFKNNLNNTNKQNNENEKPTHTQKNNSDEINFRTKLFTKNPEAKKGKEKSSAKKEKPEKVSLSIGEARQGKTSAQGFQRPLHSETKSYFVQNNWPEKEAEKFHNYYESKGWLIGNALMANWHAAANNWMLNSIKFANDKKTGNTIKPGGLNTSTDKNYSEPL